jgi:hypothetical protein
MIDKYKPQKISPLKLTQLMLLFALLYSLLYSQLEMEDYENHLPDGMQFFDRFFQMTL